MVGRMKFEEVHNILKFSVLYGYKLQHKSHADCNE